VAPMPKKLLELLSQPTVKQVLGPAADYSGDTVLLWRKLCRRRPTDEKRTSGSWV